MLVKPLRPRQAMSSAGDIAHPLNPPVVAGRIPSSGSIPVGGFTPGTVLAGRYRVVGLVGRGGMGEVYRADDLKLGHPVALKFLPRALAEDPVRRERFFAEVRITRQLSHPNICRVYDIAEFEEQHFLSMEFIDGEDLASLIRRIGHLSNQKALEIARQLFAGLAAAHEHGVLHRDLKPANIMIDGHGRVRITDFGIAVAAGEETQETDIAGTPPYMAPEQLSGKGATVRSDIYALGLILYEVTCGKSAFTARTLAELREQKEGLTPRAPSDIREGVDPILERIITRCIDRDPRARPDSVNQLAAALPGGDPLAAAVAAGETPSPEMVAASGLKEELHPLLGISLVAYVILAVVALGVMNARGTLLQRAPAEKAPVVLEDQARQFIRKAGYDTAVDHAFGYRVSTREDREEWDAFMTAEGFRFQYWYRESPRPLVHRTLSLGDEFVVDFADPPIQIPGEVWTVYDGRGRLRFFAALPKDQPTRGSSNGVDFARFFSEAGLDRSRFTEAESEQIPPSYADKRTTWQGTFPGAPDVPIRVEAAAYQGQVVFFDVRGPWKAPEVSSPPPLEGIIGALALTFALFVMVQNLRLGRGDRRGASRLAALSFGLDAGAWILKEHHVAANEWSLFLLFLASALFRATVVWVFYMALEPVIRRRRPQALVSWSRLLAGEWRDPLVGRDLLAGCAVAVTCVCLLRFANLMPAWLGYPSGAAYPAGAIGITGTRFFIAAIASRLILSIISALGSLVVVFVLKRWLRHDWALAGILTLFFPTSMVLNEAPLVATFTLPVIIPSLLVFVPLRLGLLTSATNLFIFLLCNTSPMTLDTTAWYFGTGLAAALIVVGLSVYGFRISQGSRRLLHPITGSD
jgi:serine/threonine-protein kinase